MPTTDNAKIKDTVRDLLGTLLGFRVYKLKVLKNALTNPERFKDIFTYTLAKYYGNIDYTKFIILCRARTGSTPLQLMLNSHPAIHAKSEIFTRLYGSSVDTVFNDIFAPHPPSIKAVGFKMFYNHPVDDQSGKAWDKLKNDREIKVIHLKRKNILRSLISEKIAQKTDVWGIKDENNRLSVERKRITFTAQELEYKFQQEKQWSVTYQMMFNDHPMIDVYYEDMLKSPEEELSRVTGFLGVPYVAPVMKLKRQNPEPISSLLENYDELKASFTGTEWESLLDDNN